MVWIIVGGGWWFWSRRLDRVMVDDRVREQRKLAEHLGTAAEFRATVDTRLIGHDEVVDLAAVHGYAVVRQLPQDAQRMSSDFVLRAHCPAPCGLMVSQDTFHRRRAAALRRAGGPQ
ncbi:hypothetical protein LO772_30210 [Yinghuangia sp. ASG 101]|uniref:hypothetical protein n=1 Tax=Yinghuangia sp. ASG 101 TaxID=2896848 RepID=UPI001E4F5FA7|nr:hypothetical protein [Yinghuangia sp. ASG 101]UGQ11038.1 hypothetical protein LO772_30210 [Yinghuangia sp. ASG 101]